MEVFETGYYDNGVFFTEWYAPQGFYDRAYHQRGEVCVARCHCNDDVVREYVVARTSQHA